MMKCPINQDDVEFMLGPYSSGLTKAIAPVTEQYGVPMFPWSKRTALRSHFSQKATSICSRSCRPRSSIWQEPSPWPQLAEEEGRTAPLRLAAVFENDPFSQNIRVGVLADAEKYDIEVVIDDKLPPEFNDMAPTLAAVKQLKPDILVVSGHAKGAALTIKQIEEMRVDVPMLAIIHCDSADVIGIYGDAAEHTLCASQWAPILTYSADLFGSAGDVAVPFEETYGYAPLYQAAESAAAVMVFADAFERAGSLDRDAERDALSATGMRTLYGNIKFDKTGKNIAKPMVLYQIQDGEYVVVAPTDWADAEVRHPTPAWSERE